MVRSALTLMSLTVLVAFSFVMAAGSVVLISGPNNMEMTGQSGGQGLVRLERQHEQDANTGVTMFGTWLEANGGQDGCGMECRSSIERMHSDRFVQQDNMMADVNQAEGAPPAPSTRAHTRRPPSSAPPPRTRL